MIIKIINEKTNNQFNQLKLRSAVLSKKDKTVAIVFAYPRILTEHEIKTINELTLKNMPNTFKVSIDFIKDYMDLDLLKQLILKKIRDDFFNFSFKIDEDCILTNETKEELIATINVDLSLNELMEQVELVVKLQKYFDAITNFKVIIKRDIISEKKDISIALSHIEQKQERIINKSTLRADRHISLVSTSDLVKTLNGTRPKFIGDIKTAENSCTICGAFLSPMEVQTRDGKIIYKFSLQDFTGTMKVVMFPKDKELGRLKTLVPDDEVIVNGKVTFNDYENELVFTAFNVGRCRIDDQDKVGDATKIVPDKYSLIHPSQYIYNEQKALFDEPTLSTKSLENKSFVVFDFETTGLNQINDKITEVGGVKVVNGIITEIFTTLINPEKPIPTEITDLTGITNEMVKDAPVFSEVLPDFYKFCYGSALVAHNIAFDFKFLHFNSKSTGYIFNQAQYDTIALSKKLFNQIKFIPTAPSSYNLTSVANALKIELVDAHRAINDAIVTAKVFIKVNSLCETLI